MKPIKYFPPMSTIIQLKEGGRVPIGLGPILSAQPIIAEAERLGFQLEEGDAILWRIKKIRGRLVIQAIVKKT